MEAVKQIPQIESELTVTIINKILNLKKEIKLLEDEKEKEEAKIKSVMQMLKKDRVNFGNFKVTFEDRTRNSFDKKSLEENTQLFNVYSVIANQYTKSTKYKFFEIDKIADR